MKKPMSLKKKGAWFYIAGAIIALIIAIIAGMCYFRLL